MRLGIAWTPPHEDPRQWASALAAKGYRAAVCPIGHEADSQTVASYAKAAADHGLVIAEVGIWNNPLSPQEEEAKAALDYAKKQLDLADRIGACCCVNISGSRGSQWDGPHPDNLSDKTFDLVVERTREIIDAVRPKRTYLTLEAMPWAFPNSPDSYVALIEAVERHQFAVHLDPVNMISRPERYFHNADFLRECFRKLGPYIKNCHGKDTQLQPGLTVHLKEVRPGLGALGYGVFLTEIAKLVDVPLILEHLASESEYARATEYVRGVGRSVGVDF